MPGFKEKLKKEVTSTVMKQCGVNSVYFRGHARRSEVNLRQVNLAHLM